MQDGTIARGDESSDTQLHLIRDLMLAASRRGAWLTLGEIAGLTEIGEASISAQLRHLRKRRHGRHAVEKQRRRISRVAAAAESAKEGRRRRTVAEAAKWEYRVTQPREQEEVESPGRESAAAAVGQSGGSHAEASA